MFVIFLSALKQMLILFVFMAMGYLLRKSKVVGEDMGKTLSTLELYVFMPCLTIEGFAKNCTPSVLLEGFSLVLLSAMTMLLFCIPASRLLARYLAKTQDERVTYRYSLCFPNSGYLGYPVIGAVFGEKMLLSAMMFCIPFNLATYTYGMCILLPQKGLLLKKILNPVTLAVVAGCIIGMFDANLPETVGEILEMGGNCMAPVAMILTGFVLADRPLRLQLQNVRAYIASVWRLILIPALAAIVLYLFNIRGEMFLITVSVLAMPMGLNSIIVPESYSGDVTYASQSTLVSNLLGIVTIPVVLGLAKLFA